MTWVSSKGESSRERPLRARLGAASFDLYRIGGHELGAHTDSLEEAVRATEEIYSARVDVTNSRLVVTYGDPRALVTVEEVVRRFGFSTDPEQAADVARDWQEFLQNDKLGDD